jgi:hypothetical protein
MPKAGRCPYAVSGRPMLIHTRHAMPMPCCAVALRNRFQDGMVVAWDGRGMSCDNQTRLHCANQTGKTQSKPLTVRHGRGIGTARYVWINLYYAKISSSTNKFWSRSSERNLRVDWANNESYRESLALCFRTTAPPETFHWKDEKPLPAHLNKCFEFWGFVLNSGPRI